MYLWNYNKLKLGTEDVFMELYKLKLGTEYVFKELYKLKMHLRILYATIFVFSDNCTRYYSFDATFLEKRFVP